MKINSPYKTCKEILIIYYNIKEWSIQFKNIDFLALVMLYLEILEMYCELLGNDVNEAISKA